MRRLTFVMQLLANSLTEVSVQLFLIAKVYSM